MSPFENSNNIRVAFYIRVSTEEQARDGYWADMQLQWLRDMIEYKAKHYGWSHDKRNEYLDLWCTGADLNRPHYKRMMEDAKEGKFDIVAVWKIDRLSRNLSHLLSTFEILQQNKVGFYSLKENVDFSGPIGKLTFQIFGALAEFERETIKTRTKEWKVASARLGNYILNGVPFGYDKPQSETRTNRTLTINAGEEVWVKRLFERFIHWESLEGLARMMNEHKVPKSSWSMKRPRNTKWYPQVIRERILENTTYVGKAIYKVTLDNGSIDPIEIKVPRIVSDLEFEMARNRLATISRDAKRGGGENYYLLSRKIIDTETWRKFIGVSRTKGGHSYRRKAIILNGKNYPNREIPWEKIDEQAWQMVLEALNRPNKLFEEYSLQSLDGRDYERFVAERDIFAKNLAKEEDMEIDCEEAYRRGEYTEAKKDTMVNRSLDRQKKLKYEIAQLDKHIDKIVEALATKEALISFTEKMGTDINDFSDGQRHHLLDLLIDRIEVTPSKSHPIVYIVLRFDRKNSAELDIKVEPKKSSNKPKMANWSSELSTMV